ncbi:MAG: hypothetical protein IPL96_02985 [Holophagaceae bacterium]|nr:hypothetical protein [Holophagaceae bacterium]
MKVEDLSVAVRPRRAFEAVDLGFALLRRHARAVLSPWFCVALPLGALLLLAFWKAPYWGLFAWRWLKPLLDRVPLHVLARATFSQVPGPGATLKDLWRGPKTGLFAALTWRRLAPGRAMAAPVHQLEGLKGKPFRARWAVLARSGGGAAAALLLICLCFEAVLLLALIAFLAILLPSHLAFWDWIFEHESSLGGPRCLLVLHVAATSVVEPFFVAGGFALYLNRRTALEGWDIELAFRRMARRLAPALLSLLLVGGGSLAAEEKPAPAPPKVEKRPDDPITPTKGTRPENAAQRAAVEVMRRKEFGELKEVRVPQWLLKDRKAREGKPLDLAWLGEFLAPFFKGVVLAALFAVVAWLLWHFRDQLGTLLRPRRKAAVLDTLFGLDIRPESLPDDVGAAAWKLWTQGDARAALALLYRGSLASLVHAHSVSLHAGSTEGDALRLATKALAGEGSAYFGALTLAWLHLAYRHEAPTAEAAWGLCEAWPRTFRRGEANP